MVAHPKLLQLQNVQMHLIPTFALFSRFPLYLNKSVEVSIVQGNTEWTDHRFWRQWQPSQVDITTLHCLFFSLDLGFCLLNLNSAGLEFFFPFFRFFLLFLLLHFDFKRFIFLYFAALFFQPGNFTYDLKKEDLSQSPHHKPNDLYLQHRTQTPPHQQHHFLILYIGIHAQHHNHIPQQQMYQKPIQQHCLITQPLLILIIWFYYGYEYGMA